MQQQVYPQMYEYGLGSLVGDFFQNVKDTVTGFARAVEPIAPYVLPFIPGGPAVQLGLGAGIGLAAGKKPVDVAKDLALQVGIGGLRGAIMRPEGATLGQGFMEGAFGVKPNLQPKNSGQVEGISNVFDKVKDSRLNPFSEASQFKTNPKFTDDMALLSQAIEEQYPIVGEDLTKDVIQENLLNRATLNKQLGIVPEKVKRGIAGQFLPAAATIAGLSSLAMKPEEQPTEEEYVASFTPNEYYYADPSKYQLLDITGPQGYDPGIYLAADGGEVTGGIANSGQRIEHSDGKVREHPKRIGEIAGAGTGTSDDIPAMLSDGEFVMTAKAVRNAGGGSRKAGAKNMYKMMKSLENGGSLSQQSIGMS